MQESIFASYCAFRAQPGQLLEAEREVATKEVQSLLDDSSGDVATRGIYSTSGFRADTDIMFWWISRSPEHIQDLLATLRRTQLGRALSPSHSFLGVVRPAEFAPDHLPAFLQDKAPKPYATVYPFVRTPEWYLLEPRLRGQLLKEHGDAGREFPDVLANTTSGFGLGDYEWILAFEADGLDRLVDLIRRLRATEARRYTKLEVPFVTGIRKELDAVIAELP